MEVDDRERRRLFKLLRDYRLEAGLRQADLAERLEAPQSFVSKYESGERSLSFLEVRTICEACSRSFVELAGEFEAGSR